MPSLFTASTVDRDPCGFAGSMALANESEIESNRGTICRQPSLCRRRRSEREREKFLNRQLWLGRFVDCDLFTTQRKRPGKAALLEEVINLLTLSLSLSMYKREGPIERGNNCDKQDPADKNRVYFTIGARVSCRHR